MKKIWFGGSFNPIGIQHMLAAQYAHDMGYEVHFMPCFDPPHKTDLASYSHRHEMCLIASYDNPFHVTNIEKRLYEKTGRKSYTIDTVRALKDIGETEVMLLIGSDSMNQIASWREPVELGKAASFLVFHRPGYPLNREKLGEIKIANEKFPFITEFPESQAVEIINNAEKNSIWSKVTPINGPTVDISSTLIRRRIAEGRSIKFFVPMGVERYIQKNELYMNK